MLLFEAAYSVAVGRAMNALISTFTAVLLADMAAEGLLAVDDAVAQFLPGPVPARAGRQITLLDLVTHTSGLPRLPDNLDTDEIDDPYANYTVEMMYDFLVRYSLQRDVGAHYEYSNLGVGLLGHALSLQADVDYEALVVERICAPLQMEDTRIALASDLQKRLAAGHNHMGEPVSNWHVPALAGAGALRSTANDLLKFVAANMDLGDSALHSAMESTHAARAPTGVPKMHVGMGWHILARHGDPIVWHNGGTGGYRSFIGFDKEQEFGVVVLSNSNHDIDDIGRHLLNSQYALAELNVTKKRAAVQVDPVLYDQYVGEYEIATFTIQVTREGGGLFVQLTGQPRLEVFPEAQDRFFYKEVDAQITFVSDEQGQVTHLMLHQGGIDQRATKKGAVIDWQDLSLPVETLDKYVGKYELVPGFIIAIEQKDGRLMAQATGQPQIEIFAESEVRFFYKVVDAQIEFNLDPAGQVESLTLYQGGAEQRAKKVE